MDTAAPRSAVERADAPSKWRRALGFVITTGLVVSGCVAGGSGAGGTPGAAGENESVPTVSASPTEPATTSEPTSAPAEEASSPVVADVPIRSSAPDAQEAVVVDEPQRLRVPELNIDMPVAPVGVEPGGEMEIPEDAGVAGWYQYGPAPAEGTGNAVMAAHVDSPQGLGPFGRLLEVEEGALIEVESASGEWLTYEVVDVEQTDKRDVDLEGVFAQDGPAQLVLVTCGGAWDAGRGHYDDNVIVTAIPANGIS
ncbi:class F sortase [Demequina globuliformis]|uniref:class F sortase n=1 Tax=Demequina globuliformis TaxID=676202 RepID=UPI0007827583|nr:class F sortase [Demequina globuliformis]